MDNCTNCNGECKTKIIMPCKVCSIVNGDNTPKLSYYCKFCNAYICCKEHKGINMERFLAATISVASKIAEAITPKNSTPDEKAKNTFRRTSRGNK